MPPKDFIDFLDLLAKHQCEFIVVGAYAMSAWGYVRATGDLDILISPTQKNAAVVLEVLTEFGAPLHGVSAEDFAKPATIFQIGVPPIRIDLINQLDGVSYDEAKRTVTHSILLGRSVPVISLENLIRNKTTANRPKDQADVIELKKIKAGPQK
ncbi:MAG: nucleotidyltransferase [Deltaproteobacteria bacterium]|nr:nucleotidyltransferase [Deltaproteobacteria bacterium]MBI3295283.1 nucleotidyltransferase [Deltaproteobacteria bacterium]